MRCEMIDEINSLNASNARVLCVSQVLQIDQELVVVLQIGGLLLREVRIVLRVRVQTAQYKIGLANT